MNPADFNPDDPSYSAGFESPSTKIDGEGFISKIKAGFSSPIENVKANFFSKEAYASGNRLKTGIRVAGTGIGLVMAADALRAEREGADGRPEARSGLMRVSEAVLGLGIIAGSTAYRSR